jgi:hypothetical protein
MTIKMMPGQEPYTEQELEKLNGMISGACEAEEYFSDDELEDFARKEAKKNPIT